MIFFAAIIITVGTSPTLTGFHSPHDATYAGAAAQLSDGRQVVVIISSDQRLRVSWDDGQTWSTQGGDGIGVARLWTLSYHPDAASVGGDGLFLAGGHEGVWGLDPVTGNVQQLNTGLPTSDMWILDMDSPLKGSDGPSIAITELGNVYLLDPNTLQWSACLSIGGAFMRRVAVTVQPHYDSASSINMNLFAAADGLLWHSSDGGSNWNVAPQFNTRATSPPDWSISALAMSEDFNSDRTLVIGRIRIEPANGLEFGEIWSNQGGGTFALRYALASGVHSLICSPPGPGGNRTWLAAARSFPNFRTYQDTGILLSTDGGVTWDDGGNSQDFLLEDEPGMVSGNAEMGYEQEFFVMPDYATNQEIWYVRVEGIFRSDNAGERWIQLEPINDRRCRSVSTTWGPNGEKMVFTAGWGMGGVRYDRTNDQVLPLPARSPMVFGRDMVVSPAYASDGLVLFTGNFDLWGWQDPNTPITNPTNQKRWFLPPLLNAAGLRNIDLPRYISISPNFDASNSNGDRTWFWITWGRDIRRTEDAGATSQTLGHRTNGLPVTDMTSMAVAPTYDALGTRTDVYGAYRHGMLYKLRNELWNAVANIGQIVVKMEIPSDWSRPNNPCLFLLLQDAPYLIRAYDLPSGLVVDSLQRNLAGVAPRGFTLHPDFANQPVVYIATDNRGILRLDLSSTSNQWARVGAAAVSTGHDDVALSIDFANDNLIYAATGLGLFEAQDRPTSAWTNLTTTWLRDNTWDSISTFSPRNPANPLSNHPWPWNRIERSSFAAGVILLGDEVLVAEHDDDSIRTLVTARHLEVLTYKGAGMGSITVSFIDPDTGATLASTTASLASSGPLELATVSLDNPSTGLTLVKIKAHLNSGEVFYFDGFRFSE